MRRAGSSWSSAEAGAARRGAHCLGGAPGGAPDPGALAVVPN
jgi:hypothetical protein